MEKFLAEVKVVLKKGILDVQGKTVENSLITLGIKEITNVSIGKYITFFVYADNIDSATKIASQACNLLLHNPNIETYDLTIKLIEKVEQ
ncbi:MAG: phosphoribosylformylglycinamidine synthase subunit PurS [Candidatus Kapaibacteriales bacterium]